MKRIILAATLTILSYSGAIAQDCSEIGKGSDTSQIGNCFATMTQNYATMAQTIVNLERDLTTVRESNAAVNRLLKDAVLAFNRSERDGSCPNGWSLFKPAGGRAIIGAGGATG